MRRALTALCMLAAGPALAGDAASLEILGFSADGGIFAFEEHGVQDGSGFPYANRFYINTQTDEYLPGTPVRVRIDDEQSTEGAARAEAAKKGEAILPAAILAQNRGFTAGLNSITELSADPAVLRVLPRPVFPAMDPELEIRADFYPVPASETCAGLGDAAGLRVSQIIAGQAPRILHEDKGRIPASRGCAQGYALAGIQTFYPDGGPPVFAVLIAIQSYGFEGPDYRYMAVTAPLAP